VLCIVSCKKDETVKSETEAESNEHLLGGIATSFDFSENAFGEQMNGVTSNEEDMFVIGNSFFRNNWTTAPASASARDGLGPLYNAISCGSCHFKDGRGKPTLSGIDGEVNEGLLFRINTGMGGEHGSTLPDEIYGGQIQPNGIMGVNGETKPTVTYAPVTGKYADGSTYTLRKPVYQFTNLQYGALTATNISPRLAQQLPGLGLLETVTEQTLLKNVDEADVNGDGISGRANYVWNAVTQTTTIGRFGWKANQPSLLQQTAAAFNGDIGITSNIFPKDHITVIEQNTIGNKANGGEPEITDKDLQQVVFYLQTIAVPAQRNYTTETIVKGKQLFVQLNCSGCHLPKMQTGSNTIASLNNQTIRPYTDLLLHDMGEGLADGAADFLATGNEWRTAPLWGIGMIKTVNKQVFLLHDGRARNIEEAILWHGGEAEKSKTGFTRLSKSEREAVLQFLENL
jgi:CxxC motif-containing protein (DUF1111 family)